MCNDQKLINFKMIRKCPRCDVTVQTITSIVLWLDVIVCGCTLLVQLSQAQADSCSNKSSDCSVHYRMAEILLMNIVLGFIALCGVRKKKPTLIFPYTIFKLFIVILIVTTLILWRQLNVLYSWLPSKISVLDGIALVIIFAFQIYAIFVMIWSYKQTVRILSACRPTKSFKSVVSIWIGDDSRTNMCSNNVSQDSTCIIETETR